MNSSLLLLILVIQQGVASNQDELRDLLTGASHAISHLPRDSTTTDKNKKDPTHRRQQTNDQARSNENKNRRGIISSSFGLLADTFGLAADTLRISGDTAAGILGSSIKLVGTAVKSTGSQFDNAGNWIHPKSKQFRRKQYLPTSEQSLQGKEQGRFIHGSRSMAARSVKLIGNVVQEFGDMLLMTGAATESIGSLTASVAEDSMRLLEDLAESIAASRSSPLVPERLLVRPKSKVLPEERPTVTYGSHDEPLSPTSASLEPDHYVLHSSISQALLSMLRFLIQDTGGVPSQAAELFVVFALCYVATFLAIRGNQQAVSGGLVIKQEDSYDSRQRTWVRYLITLAALPIRVIFLLSNLVVFLVFNRYTLLACGYLLAWIQVCHMSQIRSRSIYSTAEAQGFRFALASLHEVKPSVRESTVWLNTLMQQIWRVPSSECPSYPAFVRDGIKACGRDAVRDCIAAPCEVYGGLEPYLSWTLGDALTAALDTSRVSRPRSIAFASLQSISLGSHPPTIRHIEVLGVSEDGQKTEYLIDFDLALDDLNLVLEIKLSSLDFALLPTTKVAVGALLTTGRLKITATSIPETPYLSRLQISLAHALDCKVRITPLGDER